MDDSSQYSNGEDDDAAELLDVGGRALKLLSMRVELAKAEALRFELEALFLQAQSGEFGPLRRWLQANGDLLALDSSSVNQRSQIHQTHLEWSRSVSPLDSAEHRKTDQPDSAEIPLPTWEEIRERSVARLSENVQQNESQSDSFTSSPLGPRPKEKSETAIDQKIIKAVSRQGSLSVSKRGWRYRGVVISALAHFFLILALGLVTIHVPLGQGILEFQASADSQSTLESLDMVEPLQTSEPMEVVDSQSTLFSPSLENALPDMQPVDSTQLGDLTAVDSSNDSAASMMTQLRQEQVQQLAVNFYGASATGNCFCFLIDGSATMRGAPWEAARAELIRTLQTLSENQRFYVIFYHRLVNRIPDPNSGMPATMALYASRENLQHAFRWLQTQRVEATIPGGNQTTVLQAAIELEPDAIFYLTDGQMSDSVQRNVLQLLRRLNRVTDVVEGEVVRIPVNTIAFHSAEGVEIMQRIAVENRGQSTFVPPPATR
jgi:hypothetical protein